MRIFVIFSLLFSLSFSSQASPNDTSNNFDFNNSQNSFDLNTGSTQNFVSVDQAFIFQAIQNGNALNVEWQIKPGYYLYQNKIKITGQGVNLTLPSLPKGIHHYDEFFGDVIVYADSVFLTIPLQQVEHGARLTIQYQGCAQAGFCYPPQTRTITLSPQIKPTTTPSSTLSNTGPQNDIAQALVSHKLTLLLMFVFGIGLAFTPCVLPMYPILTGLVLGQKQITRKKAWWMSFSYVQGMALTYTLLGLMVASAGIQFQLALQSPVVLIAICLLFIALSLSMFGVYTLQLPSGLQTRLNQLSNHQKSGHFWGVFLMGAISGLVCSPCTTAPLSGALLYVAQTGNLAFGAIALYLLGLGMGVPLIAVALFGQKILPKSGEWMNRIKTLFGFVLLAAPIFLIERLIPELWGTLLWSLLGLCAFSWLYKIKNTLPFGSWKQTSLGIIAVLGLIGSLKNPVIYIWAQTHPQPVEHTALSFIQIHTLDELNAQLAKASNEQRPVMLDFYADWCVACKEFEKYTFSDSQVQAQLSQITILQVNATKNTADVQAILHTQQVLGLPTIDFWDKSGTPQPTMRITGFLDASQFSDRLKPIMP